MTMFSAPKKTKRPSNPAIPVRESKKRLATRIGLLVTLLGSSVSTSDAFVSRSGSKILRPRVTLCEAGREGDNQEQISSRRDVISSIWGSAVVLGTLAIAPQNSEATYSAYTRREDDWKQRNAKGQVTYSNAKLLRKQLAELVPENTEGSRIFCPNGPSAAVSPLMENKCGDRLAAPSVYGRTQDIVGNSIPGFSDATERLAAVSAMRAELPSYN